LLRRTFDFDVFVCVRSGGRRRAGQLSQEPEHLLGGGVMLLGPLV
jgi:hypothetical protein